LVVITQREVLYKVLLSSWYKKSYTHLAKGVLSSSVQVLVLGVSKSEKGKSQVDCLGTGRRSQGSNQDKISYLCVCIFWVLFCEFYFPASSFI